MRQIIILIFISLLLGCSPKLTYEGNIVDNILNGFGNSTGNSTKVILQNLNLIGVDFFEVELTYEKDDNADNSAKLYFCSETDSPGCNPLNGTSYDMVKGNSKFLYRVQNLTSPYGPGSVINYLIVVSDDDGIEGTLNSQTLTLLSNNQTQLGSEVTSNITQNGLQVDIPFSFDSDGDSSAELFYCNLTSNPGCLPNTLSVSMTKNSGNFRAILSGLTNSREDTYRLKIVVSDSDGVTNAPSEFDVTLLEIPAIQVYRSVGVGSTGALYSYSDDLYQMTISNGVISFTGDIPENIGVGDAIVYNTSNNIMFIDQVTDRRTFRVKLSDGETLPADISAITDYQVFRSYTSFVDAESGEENSGIPTGVRNFDTWSGGKDLVSSKQQWNIAFYADGFEEVGVGNPTINGWVTSEHYPVRLFTPHLSSEVNISQRHNGVIDRSKFFFHNDATSTYRRGVSIQTDAVIIDGLQFIVKNNDFGAASAIFTWSGGWDSDAYHTFSNNIIEGHYSGSGGGMMGIKVGNSSTDLDQYRIFNNIVYGFKGDYTNTGINVNGTGYVYNNTVYNCRNAFEFPNGSTILKNNLVSDVNDSIKSISNYDSANSGHNIFFNADTPYHSTDRVLTNIRFNMANAHDYRLSGTDFDAIGTGADLSSDPHLAITKDIMGQSRTTWDVGAANAPLAIFRSVGPGNSSSLKNGSDRALSVTVSSNGHTIATLTGSTDIETKVGVGDVIQYDADAAGGPSHLAFIHKRIDGHTFYVKDASGNNAQVTSASSTSWDIFRSYLSSADAESATNENTSLDDSLENFDTWESVSGNPHDLVSKNTQYNIALYADDADSYASFIYWITDDLRRLKLFSPHTLEEVGVSQRHQGLWDNTKARFTADRQWRAVVEYSANYFILEGLQVENIGTRNTSHATVLKSETTGAFNGGKRFIIGNILRHTGPGAYDTGDAVIDNGGDSNRNITKYLINNILYGGSPCFGGTTAWTPNNLVMFAYHNVCYFETASGGFGTIGTSGFNNVRYKNNIAVNLGAGSDWTVSNLTEEFEGNISTDATSPSSATYENVAINFLSPSIGDFRLLDDSTTAVDNGVDLSDDEFYVVDTDIAGNSRAAPYDSGAFSYTDVISSLTLFDQVGAGTASAPYLIGTKTQLTDFGESCTAGGETDACNAHVDIVKDINMSGETWSTIGGTGQNFTGTIDGLNNDITNLTINSLSDFTGFVGLMSGATLKNLNITADVNMNNNKYGGVLLGLMSGGSIENVMAFGSVRNCNFTCGGLLGRANGGTISNSSTDVEMRGASGIGGLIGICDNASINSSYALGDVIATGSGVGGLIGSGGKNSSTFSNVFAKGNVQGSTSVGGLIGGYSRSLTLRDCFATGNVKGSQDGSSQSFVGGLVGRMHTNTGAQVIDNCYALGDVYAPGDFVGGLVGDIDNSGPRTIQKSWAAGDVKGYSSTGGLVGRAQTTDITDSFAVGNVNGNFIWSGGLVGYYQIGPAAINRSFALGDVTGNRASGTSGAGGLVGGVNGTSISNSYARGNVYGRGDDVGGLVGVLNSSGNSLSNSHAFGSVIGRNEIGGLVGTVDTGSLIDRSSSYGSVNGTNSVGGFVGLLEGTSGVSNSFSTGDVFASSGLGGFIGTMTSNGSVQYNHSRGSVFGTTNNRAFMGSLITGTFTNNYWNSDTVNLTDGTLDGTSSVNEFEPLNDSEFKYSASFVGFDFSGTGEWYTTDNIHYPIHRHTPQAECLTILTDNDYDGIGSGTLADPHIICNEHQLINYATNACTEGINTECNLHFKLGADIDFKGKSFIGIGGPTETDAYTGIFDGNHYTISNIVMKSHTSFNGLFRYLNGAMIRNLNVDNADVDGSTNNSSVASFASSSYLINVHVKNSETRGSWTNSAGGLIAEMTSHSVITNSSYSGIVSGNSSVGGLVGNGVGVHSGIIQRSSSHGTIGAYGSSVGGILGTTNVSHPAILRKVSSTGLRDGSANRTGGLCGQRCHLYESFSSANINTSAANTGGLTGSGGRFYNSYVLSSSIVGAGDVGAVGGEAAGGDYGFAAVSTITEGGAPVGKLLGNANTFGSDWLFYDTTVNTATFSDNPSHIESKTTTELKTFSTYTTGGADYSMWEHSNGYSALTDEIWLIDDGQKYPMLSWQLHPICQRNFDAKTYNAIGSGTFEDPYLLCFREQVIDLSVNGCDDDSTAACSSHFKVLNDMDFEGLSVTPIGSNTNNYSGHFNGANHTLSSLSIESTDGRQALFGVTNEAIIENIRLRKINVSAPFYASSLVSHASGGEIRNIDVSGANIFATFTGYAGGISAALSNGVVLENVHFRGDVSSSVSYAGGIVAYMNGGGCLIKNSSTKGSVSATAYVGGIAGTAVSGASIIRTNSSSTVTQTTSSAGHVGGIVGQGAMTLRYVYSTGEINGIDDSTGGLVGSTSLGADISHSFFNGVINSSGDAGGFVGISNSGSISYSYAVAGMSGVSGVAFGFSGSTGATFNDNYWDSTVSGVSTGGVAGEYEPLTTVQMKNSANFSTWDSGVWEFVDYPDFRKFD